MNSFEFNKLPPELRKLIIDCALLGECMGRITTLYRTFAIPTKDNLSSLLSVNREIRSYALKFYSVTTPVLNGNPMKETYNPGHYSKPTRPGAWGWHGLLEHDLAANSATKSRTWSLNIMQSAYQSIAHSFMRAFTDFLGPNCI
ncbi:hypothetical protein F4810DRAFT_712349 [Camillea tinctor]|nr:hypothetical protein F4810DRAFT_712349 [Camillea tinctor]